VVMKGFEAEYGGVGEGFGWSVGGDRVVCGGDGRVV